MTNSVNVSKSGVLYSGISDHSFVYVIRKFKRPKSEPKLIKTRSFKNFVEDNFLRDLRNADWTYFLNFSDLDRACKVFNDILSKLWLKNMRHMSLTKSKAKLKHGSHMIFFSPSKRGIF